MQSADFAAHNEPEPETAPEQIETPRFNAPLPPQFGQCCYPIGEPRTPGFRYCTARVAQRGAPYCLEHMLLCHVGRGIAA
jgi:GcrA cell cycle regulator